MIRARWSGGLLAAGAACLLVLQTLIASVGLGMSAASPFGQPAFDICSAVATDSLNAPEHKARRHPKQPSPAMPLLLFRRAMRQSPGAVGNAKAFPAFAVDSVAASPYEALNYRAVHRRHHRTTGDPRGPPSFPI